MMGVGVPESSKWLEVCVCVRVRAHVYWGVLVAGLKEHDSLPPPCQSLLPCQVGSKGPLYWKHGGKLLE